MGLSTNLVAGWTLGEASGSRADSVGANTLTDNNTVTQATGKVGDAAQFTSTNNESLSIADNADLSMGDIDFALAGWVYFDSTGNRGLFGKYNYSSNQREYVVVTETSGTLRFRFAVSADGSGNTTVNSTAGVPATSTWYFVVAWHDATANKIYISVNDQATPDELAHSTGVLNGTSAFRLGGLIATVDGYAHNGRMDEVAVWKNYIPSAAERTWLYNSGNGRSIAEIQAYETVGQPAGRRMGLAEYMGAPLELGRSNVKVF